MLKHLAGGRVQSPITALSNRATILVVRADLVPRHFHEAIVEAEIVPNAVLPALTVLPIVWESVHDEAVDAGKRQPSLRCRIYGHRYQGDVRIRRLFVTRRRLAGDRRCCPGERRLAQRRPGNAGSQHPRNNVRESVGMLDCAHPAEYILARRKGIPGLVTPIVPRTVRETSKLSITKIRLHRESS